MEYLIGIDLGTQSTKAGLVAKDGSILCEAAIETNLIYPEKGAVIQDPEEMLGSVLTATKELIDKAGIDPADVEGICLDGQMAGVMAVDEEGMAATPYDSWLDTRCGSSRHFFLGYGEERVIEITGAPVSYTAGPKIMWWKENHPDIYKKVFKFVQPAAYATMRLCGLKGEDAFYDHTYLHFSGFADTKNKTWSEELIRGIGADESKFPRILKPYDKVGGLTEEMAAACGLKSGTPLVAGCGDTAATSFGAGVTKPGLMFDVAGSASVLACAVDKYAPDTKNKTIMFAPSVAEGLYTPMAYINGGGMCLKWFRDDVLGKSAPYRDLDALAAEIKPGSENLLFVPQFSGRVCPNDTNVRGAFIGLQWVHGKGHLFRAIMEGIAYEYLIYKDIIDELVQGQDYERVLCVGGGSASKVFNQIKADALGVPVSTGSTADTALLACASIAGYGVGLFDDIAELTLNDDDYSETIKPDRSNTDIYKTRKEIFADLYGEMHDTYRRLLAL